MAVLAIADLEIDALGQHVRQGAREVRLSPHEHILLYILASSAGAVVSYRELSDALGQRAPGPNNNSLARHLSTLRAKLRDDAKRPRYIETIPGTGLRFVMERET